MTSRRRLGSTVDPRQKTSPPSAGKTPARASSRVVLPAPFGPIRPITSLRCALKEMSDNAG